MKPETHPDYHKVIFVDSATGTEWVSRSTMTSKETREHDGEEVPVFNAGVSKVKFLQHGAAGRVNAYVSRRGHQL